MKPANPTLIETNWEQPPATSQITLRDLYAGFALAGLLARPCTNDIGETWAAYDEDDAVKRSFSLADMMLKAREGDGA